jgi:hypothetical protein
MLPPQDVLTLVTVCKTLFNIFSKLIATSYAFRYLNNYFILATIARFFIYYYLRIFNVDLSIKKTLIIEYIKCEYT